MNIRVQNFMRFQSSTLLWASVIVGFIAMSGSVVKADDDETKEERWVRQSLNSYVPSLGGAVESIGTATYEDLVCYAVGLTDRERQRVVAYMKDKLEDHTLFTRSLQEARLEGRDDDYVRARRRAYNADVYRGVNRIVGAEKVRRLKQLALQLNLKKFLIGDEGLRELLRVSDSELDELGPILREGDRLGVEIGAGVQLVPIYEQVANTIRAMSEDDRERLHLLLGPPMCHLYQRVCDELGGDDWPDLDDDGGSGRGRGRGRGPNSGNGNGKGNNRDN